MMNKKILCAQKQVKTKKADGKTMYKAVARMKDDDHEWDVLIYSMYETVEEAERVAEWFLGKYSNNDSFVHCLYVKVLKAVKEGKHNER